VAKSFKLLRERMSPKAQERARKKVQLMIAEIPLHELRRARELSQQNIADRLCMKQAAVSKMERRTDMYISTLRSYIEAMGGSLDVIARFPEGDVQVMLFSECQETSDKVS
jgi:ribosome-binding protein aMBF1 (putative translation factor)